MASPAKVIELELDAPLRPLEPLDGYRSLYVLVRLHGTPIGHVEVRM